MTASTAVIIGTFDGVHAGHASLLAAARREVGEGRIVVLAFDPHPLSTLRPETAPPRLSRFGQRAAWLAQAGADLIERLEPTNELLGLAPEAFIADVVERFRPDVIVAGTDFGFGRGRTGNVDTLRRLESTHGYRTVVVDPFETEIGDRSVVTVSSSLVRWLISHGRVGDAALLLGRPYELIGPIVQGDQRGRELGVPTANLDHGDFLLPGDGVYAGRGQRPDGTWYPAAISVGTKPTFGEHPRVCEAHLLGFDGPLDEYGWMIRLQVTRWLRDQLRYDGVEPLREQLRRDLAQVRRLVRLQPDQMLLEPTA